MTWRRVSRFLAEKMGQVLNSPPIWGVNSLVPKGVRSVQFQTARVRAWLGAMLVLSESARYFWSFLFEHSRGAPHGRIVKEGDLRGVRVPPDAATINATTPPAQMNTAAIYVPVGTPDQDQGIRLSGLRLFAVGHGLSVLEYPERHARARTRPVYSKLLRDATSHKFDFVIVESLDCFALSLADLCAKVTELHRLGIRLIAVNECIDLDPGTAAKPPASCTSSSNWNRSVHSTSSD
jgi:hypothetical protein